MKTPLVVGYKGEIGSFILNGLLRTMPKALDILCIDINETDEEVVQRIQAATIIFLCVPLSETKAWLTRNKTQIGDTPVVEQCSLKAWLYKDEDLKGINFVSMHLLFRPSQTPNYEDRRVGFFSGQARMDLNNSICAITQAQPVWFASASGHDGAMAVQQALVHRAVLILDAMIEAHDGPTYVGRQIQALAARIRGGDHELYKLIQGNEYLSSARAGFNTLADRFDMDEMLKWPR